MKHFELTAIGPALDYAQACLTAREARLAKNRAEERYLRHWRAWNNGPQGSAEGEYPFRSAHILDMRNDRLADVEVAVERAASRLLMHRVGLL